MNYYIVTNTKYNDIDKSQLLWRVKSIDKSKVLIMTPENVSSYVTSFSDADEVEEYTSNNHADWVGDGSCVEAFELLYGSRYIQGIDD